MPQSLGEQQHQGTPVPAIPNFIEVFRTVAAANDVAVAAVPAAERLYLGGNNPITPTSKKCRWGVGNTVLISVKAAALGVKVTLWAKILNDYFWVASLTTTQANQVLIFDNVPAFEIVPHVETVVNPTVLGAGFTI